jgi:hypothetical protein
MNSETLVRIEKLKRSALPRAFAILRDGSRRGGVRVARVVVVERWDPMQSAAVEELNTALPHCLPFARLSTGRGRVLRAKVRDRLEFRAAAKEAQSAAVQPLAGKVAAA